MRKVHILPNLFTAGSLFCAVLAIFEVFNLDAPLAMAGEDGGLNAHLVSACILLLASGFFDVFDGAVARLTHSTSRFGLNFDSLSDLVAFGVAPSLLAYVSFGASFPRLYTAVCGLYIICGAMRLARYNVQSSQEESKLFTGMPIPGAAGAVVALVWIAAARPELAEAWHFDKFCPPAMVIVAYLMVSKIPFGGLKSMALGRQPFELLVALVVVCFLLFMLRDYMYFVLFVMSYGYLIICVALGLKHQIHDHAYDQHTSEAEGLDH